MELNKPEKVYLLKLVDRDIKMDKFYDGAGWPHCPACGSLVGDGKFCKHCGQRLEDDGDTE